VEGWRRYGEAGAARGGQRREVELAIDGTHLELVGGYGSVGLFLIVSSLFAHIVAASVKSPTAKQAATLCKRPKQET
jgi:hypothetical protein